MINNKVNVNNTQPLTINNTKAFSLIELSIVLIIVALIIGGIISGKSLVTNSKIVTVASDVKSLNIALQSFQDSFGMLPGDITTTIGGIVEDNTKGNGDWYIGNGHPLNKESVNAFAHLSKANFINEKFEGNNTPNKISDLTKDHYIESKSFKNTFLYLGATNFGSKANTANRIMFVSTKTGNSFTPAVAKAYNCKFDNCDPFTGKVISLNIKYDLESTASNEYKQNNFNLINSAKAEEANSNACVDANGYTTTTKEVCTVNISDLNINDNKESYVTDSGKTGDVSLGDKNTNPDGSSPSNPGGGDGGSSGGGSTSGSADSTPDTDLNDPDLEEKTKDEAEKCGMPTYVKEGTGETMDTILTVGGTNYNFIKSFEGLPTDKSNLDKTFSATCKTGYTADLNEGEATPKITFTCKKATDDATTASWIATAGACKTIETPLSKCWSASGGRTVTKDWTSEDLPNADKNGNDKDATLADSYSGFMDTDCCNPTKGKYVDLDLKLQRALCEKEAATYGECTAFNQTKYDTAWKSRPKQEKLIKFISLYQDFDAVDLKCVNLSGLKMDTKVPENAPQEIKDLVSKALNSNRYYNDFYCEKKEESYTEYCTLVCSAAYDDETEISSCETECKTKCNSNLYIYKFNTVAENKNVYFSFRPAPFSAKSTLNDVSNLANANFPNISINSFYCGVNYYSSGNPSCNLTNANFSGSIFSGDISFGSNNNSSGNPSANLTNANFSNTILGGDHEQINFCSNSSSYGNPNCNFANINFSNSSYKSYSRIGFAYNEFSSGSPILDLTNANFSNITIENGGQSFYFGSNINSSGNPSVNLTNANFLNTNLNFNIQDNPNVLYFGYNYSSSGNPGTNVKGAKFGGKNSDFISKKMYINNPKNVNMMLASFYNEDNQLISKADYGTKLPGLPTLPAGWSTNPGPNVYNPYCNANKNNCCLKPDGLNQSNAEPSTCSATEKWDGTK